MNASERKELVKKLNIELRIVLEGSHAIYLKQQKRQ